MKFARRTIVGGISTLLLGHGLIQAADEKAEPASTSGPSGQRSTTLASAGSTRLGLNIGSAAYWTGNRPFINIARSTSSLWQGLAPTTSNRGGKELVGLQPGERVFLYVILHVHAAEGYVRPGRYAVTWDGDIQLSFKHTGEMKNIRTSPNRLECTVTALTEKNSGGIFLSIEAHNPTGRATNLQNLAIVHEDDWDAHKAGEIFSPSWLEQVRTASVIRFMDWGSTNNSEIVKPEDFTSMNETDWTRPPPRILGLAGTQAKCDIWVCVPHRANRAAMEFFFREISSTYPKGKVYVEYSNEVWNWQFKQPNWLGRESEFAAGESKLASSINIGAGAGALRSWAAAEKVFGADRIVRVFSGQAAAFDALSAAFSYTDASLFGGKPLKDLIHVYAIAPYFDMSVGGGRLPTDQGARARCERKDHLQPDSYFVELARNSIKNVSLQVNDSARRLKAIAPKAKLISYEAGTHEFVSLDDYHQAKKDGPKAVVDVNKNVLSFSEEIKSLFDDGDEAYVFYCGDRPLYATGPDAQSKNTGWTPFKVRKVDSFSLRCYANEEDFQKDRPVRLLQSGSVPEDRSRHYVGNFTRLALLGQRIQKLMDSDQGVELYERYFASLQSAGLELFMHFADSNNYGDLRSGSKRSFQFGLKRSHFEDDRNYPRSRWFKTLAKARRG